MSNVGSVISHLAFASVLAAGGMFAGGCVSAGVRHRGQSLRYQPAHH
jgi:hypothetical protein